MTGNAPLGAFEEQVLLAIVRAREEPYGMQVRREIERVTERAVAIGAVYATLDRLEAKGLIVSRRADEGGVSRRLFRLAPAGVRELAETRVMRDRMWRGVDLDLGLARRKP